MRTEDFLDIYRLYTSFCSSCVLSNSFDIGPVPLAFLWMVVWCEFIPDLACSQHAEDFHFLIVFQLSYDICVVFDDETTIHKYSRSVVADEGFNKMIAILAVVHARTEKDGVFVVPLASQDNFAINEIRDGCETAVRE